MEDFLLAGEKEAEKEMGEEKDEDEDDEDTCKLFAEVSLSLLLSSLELSDTHVYAPSIRALLGTALCFCEVVALKLRTRGPGQATSMLAPKWQTIHKLTSWVRGTNSSTIGAKTGVGTRHPKRNVLR